MLKVKRLENFFQENNRRRRYGRRKGRKGRKMGNKKLYNFQISNFIIACQFKD